jgi:hypothetical protein
MRERARKQRNYAEQLARKQANDGKFLFAAANAVVPKSYPAHVRDDVISEIVIAVLEDKITVKDIGKEAPGFMRAYWREYSHYGRVSLDAVIPGSKTSYHDRFLTDN